MAVKLSASASGKKSKASDDGATLALVCMLSNLTLKVNNISHHVLLFLLIFFSFIILI